MGALSGATHPKTFRLNFKPYLTGLLLISPWLAGLFFFKVLPILASLAISFTNFHMLSPDETTFIGLDNYLHLFHDSAAGYFLFQTFAVALGTLPLQVIASVGLAALLHSPRLKSIQLLRTLFFLPSIIPSVAILFMWRGFTDSTTGWLTRLFLAPLGLATSSGIYVQAATGFLFAISALWSIGPGMLIILGALQSVSREVLEAARVDGAGPITRFFSITLPLISPAVFFTLIINLITVFGGVILLDRGNFFSGSSSPYDGYVGLVMFTRLDLGYAASLAWWFFLLSIVLVLILFATSKKWVFYGGRD